MSDNIREKIAKLRALAQNEAASEAEALASLKKAARLMEEHQITEEDLEKLDKKKDFILLEVDKKNKHCDPAIKLCGSAVEKFCDLQMWISDGGAKTSLFGLKADAEMGQYLLEMLIGAMSRGYREYLRSAEAKSLKADGISIHKIYWAYRHGFANRVNATINGLIAERDKKMDDQVRTGGTDLIARKDALVADALSVLLPHLKIRPGRRSKANLAGAADAYRSGQADGEKVNLNRPLEGKGAQKKIGRAA